MCCVCLSQINQYLLIKTLGKGTFAKVKLGQDNDGVKWALKRMDMKSLRKKNKLNSLRSEIGTLAHTRDFLFIVW